MRTGTAQRPVLRYHGGKWRIARWIISHFPPHRIYVEPYGGAGSVLMRKERSDGEIYNDLDDEIVNVFRVLRSPRLAGRLERQLRLTPYSRAEFLQSFQPAHGRVERARRTITRLTMSHGSSGRRVGMTGFRSKCWAQRRNEATTWREYPDQIALFVDRLQGVVIENRPALDVIRQHDSSGTLFYVDPPYVISTRTGIRSRGEAEGGWRNYRHNLTDQEHRELVQVLKTCEGMVVLSGYDSELYRDLLPDWRIERKETLADGGRRRTEMLWLSSRTVAAYPQPSLCKDLFREAAGEC
jgi:DNA adenine methylase